IAEEVDRHQHSERGPGAEEHRHEHRERVAAERVAVAARAAAAEKRERAHRRGDEPDDADRREPVAILPGDDQVDDHRDHPRTDAAERGERGPPAADEVADVDRRHRAAPTGADAVATAAGTRPSMRWSDGSMRERNGVGKRPITKHMTSTGTSTTSSRALTS